MQNEETTKEMQWQGSSEPAMYTDEIDGNPPVRAWFQWDSEMHENNRWNPRTIRFEVLTNDAPGTDGTPGRIATITLRKVNDTACTLTQREIDAYNFSDGGIKLNAEIDPAGILEQYAPRPVDDGNPYRERRSHPLWLLNHALLFANVLEHTQIAWEHAEGGYPVYGEECVASYEVDANGLEPFDNQIDAKLLDAALDILKGIHVNMQDLKDNSVRCKLTLLRPYVNEWYVGYR